MIYNGTPQRPVLSITSGGTALEETDFSITVRYNGGAAADFSSARFQDAGTYTITVSGKPDTPYAGSEVTVGYVIRPAELDTLTLELPAAGYTYDGTAKSPAPSVTSKTVVTAISPMSRYTPTTETRAPPQSPSPAAATSPAR